MRAGSETCVLPQETVSAGKRLYHHTEHHQALQRMDIYETKTCDYQRRDCCRRLRHALSPGHEVAAVRDAADCG